MPSLPIWKTPLVRQPGWERGYAETLQRHLDQPFSWGISDCIIVPADLCDAMCGRNPFPTDLRTYRSEVGAAKLMRGLGFSTVQDALAAVFPAILKLRARRGDCGILSQLVEGKPQLATMIVLGDGSAVGKGPQGLARVSLDRLVATYAIGAA